MQLQVCVRVAHLLLAVALLAVLPSKICAKLPEASGVLVGTAARPSVLLEAPYSETLAREFSMVEPEEQARNRIGRQEYRLRRTSVPMGA